MRHAAENRIAIWIAAAVFVAFAALYFAIGSYLAELPIYVTSDNVFFGADHLEAVRGWTTLAGSHYHDGAHPLTILLLVPLGTLLSALTESPAKGVLVLNVAGGALTVALAYGCFFLLARHPYRVLAPTLFLALA